MKGYPMNNLVSVFKLLSDETRLRIIMLLKDNQLCVCQLTGILSISQPKASKALSKLRDLNLVTDERKDKFVYYSLNDNHPLMINILEFIKGHINEYDQLKEDLSRLELRESFLTSCSTTILKV